MNINLFSTLSRFNSSEENFLTESFVYLLNQLMLREPEQCISFLQKLIGKETIEFSDEFIVSITTQLSLEEGRPDICIQTTPDTLFFIEVKHDSPLHIGQLEAYYSELLKSGKTKTKLILLTRSKQTAIQTTLSKSNFEQVCWYEIYNWLLLIKKRNEIINYLITDFLLFLEEKAMNLVKVEWEYPNGLKAFINLTNMLQAVIEEVDDSKLKRTGGWSWRGFYIGNVFCGVRYDKPNLIVFENNLGTNPTFKIDYSIEKEHFLAFSKEEQFESLVKFIKESFEKYRLLDLSEPLQEFIKPMEEST